MLIKKKHVIYKRQCITFQILYDLHPQSYMKFKPFEQLKSTIKVWDFVLADFRCCTGPPMRAEVGGGQTFPWIHEFTTAQGLIKAQKRGLIKWMQGNFIAQLNELGILKRTKNIFNKFQKGMLQKSGGWAWPPDPPVVVGGPTVNEATRKLSR